MNQTKSPILSPDKIALKTMYAITINPDDSYQFFKDVGRERIKKATNHITYVLRQYPNVHMSLTIDVSRVGRIHWHGTVLFTHFENVKDFFLEYINDLVQHHQIEIDTIKDPKVWSDYCHKTLHLFNVNITTQEVMKKRLLTNNPTVIKYKTIDCYNVDTLEEVPL